MSSVKATQMAKRKNSSAKAKSKISSQFSSPGRVSSVNLYQADHDDDDSSSVDDFWREDLTWPDPEKKFSETSGIRPAVLTASNKAFRGHHKTMDGGQGGVETRCTSAKAVRMPPRPTSLPWNVLVIHSDPPQVDEDDVEEFLVHDPLFVEFFNAFLSLPSFPEPICFNVETGGFEVVSDGKRRLAQQIKEAVRSQNITAKMYRVARSHAFSHIPLIPIEDAHEGPGAVKIDTSFDVTTLNKDQGIYWIKAERLPIFLESDYYFQYRLAKVISQARIFNDKGEFVVMKIDFTTRPKKKKVSVEVPPPNLEEKIMKEMFVSFGDVRGAAKEAWFDLAKAKLENKEPFTSLGSTTAAPAYSTPTSKDEHSDKSRQDLQTHQPKFANNTATEPEPALKPPTLGSINSLKKSSVFHSHFFGVYAPGLIGPNDSEPQVIDMNTVNTHMETQTPKPFTPRPNERMFQSTNMVRKKITPDPGADEYMVPASTPVYVRPKQDLSNVDAESGIGEMEEKEEEFEKRMYEQPILDMIYNDGSWEQDSGNITLNSLDELGSVIVGAVMKKTVSEMLKVEEAKAIQDPAIRNIYPSPDLTCVTVNDLDLLVVHPPKKDTVKESLFPLHVEAPAEKHIDTPSKTASMNTQPIKAPSDSTSAAAPPPVAKEPVHIKWDKPMKPAAEEESDADSLLDSDEDFEERDSHFRRNKDKWHSLNSWKGIQAFKDFLCGTSGEKYWHLWIDIDKGRLIQNEEDKQRYIEYMRNTYHRKGAPFELSAEDKKKLGLESLATWCPEYLYQIHAKILEPLVLYWAPRYLLRNLLRAHPEKYKEYNEMKACQPSRESDPFPQTAPLLPLRPKSCCPRIRSGPEPERKINVPDAFKPKEPSFGTSPMVGNHRVYGEDTIRRLANTPSAKVLGLRPPKAPTKAPSGRGPSAASGMASARSARRISTPGSLTLEESVIPEVALEVSSSADVARSGKSGAKLAGVTPVQQADSFVGKMRGTASLPTSAVGHNRSPSEQVVARSSASKRSKRQGLSRNLDGTLGQQETPAVLPSLGAVSKPKDLVSPMLKIVDTKQETKSKRIRSAPAQELLKGSNANTFYRQDSQSSSRKCPGDIASTADDQDSLDPTGDAAKDIPVVAIQDCDFMGSTRLEFLLQALHHENDAGRSLRKYIEKSGRQDWINNLDFWEKVQQYRKLFYKDKLDLFLISWQAKAICAQCIVEGAEKLIGVSESVELQILERLSPAYECLFDEAEEHALKKLFEAFQLYLGQDVKTYGKVERSSITRRLETKNTYILNLQKKGIIKERPLTPDDPMAGYVDPVYDESVLERIPEKFRDWTLDKLLHNRIELEHFRLFLAENYAEVDLKCWMDIETWRRTPHEEDRKRDQRARDIKKNYLNKKYFFGPSSPAGKEGQNKVMDVGGGWGKFLEDKPHSRSILEAQKYVRERLEKKHLAWFLASKEFQERQSPKLSVSDSADDVVTQKRKRTAAVLKTRLSKPYSPAPLGPQVVPPLLLESRWVTSAKEINCFRQALKNPLTCELFQQFVSLQGENLENDVLFWLEVQKYKEMHHSHTEDSMLNQKIGAIINCFIESSIPPSLQIDIPQDMADRILEHKHERGPYLFREAQLATFRILLQHWQPFVEFRNNMVTTERAKSTLERHRVIARKREQEHRDAMEAQRERERLQKLEEEMLGTDAVDDEERGAKLGFSYSMFLQEMLAERSKDTQTPRSEDDPDELMDFRFGRDREKKAEKEKNGGSEQGASGEAGKSPAGTGDKENLSGSQAASDRRGSSLAEKRRASQISGTGVNKREKEEQSKQKQQVKKKNSPASADHSSSRETKSSPSGPQDLGVKRSPETKKSKHFPILAEVSEENI